jgi:hypothetical protein
MSIFHAQKAARMAGKPRVSINKLHGVNFDFSRDSLYCGIAITSLGPAGPVNRTRLQYVSSDITPPPDWTGYIQ